MAMEPLSTGEVRCMGSPMPPAILSVGTGPQVPACASPDASACTAHAQAQGGEGGGRGVVCFSHSCSRW